jgi:hypothetical protein
LLLFGNTAVGGHQQKHSSKSVKDYWVVTLKCLQAAIRPSTWLFLTEELHIASIRKSDRIQKAKLLDEMRCWLAFIIILQKIIKNLLISLDVGSL